MDSLFSSGNIISTYTRKQAIADGVLIDTLPGGKTLTSLAAEAGIRWPVAFTSGAYDDAVGWYDDDGMQNEEGRAWDVLWMASAAFRNAAHSDNTQLYPGRRFPIQFLRVAQGATRPSNALLHAVFTIDDDNSPCWTFMLPTED